jgi:hypothetical protein
MMNKYNIKYVVTILAWVERRMAESLAFPHGPMSRRISSLMIPNLFAEFLIHPVAPGVESGCKEPEMFTESLP